MPNRERSGPVTGPPRVVRRFSVTSAAVPLIDRAGALPNHDIEARNPPSPGTAPLRIAVRHPVNLVDEQHFVLAQAGQIARERPGRSSTGPAVAPRRLRLLAR